MRSYFSLLQLLFRLLPLKNNIFLLTIFISIRGGGFSMVPVLHRQHLFFCSRWKNFRFFFFFFIFFFFFFFFTFIPIFMYRQHLLCITASSPVHTFFMNACMYVFFIKLLVKKYYILTGVILMKVVVDSKNKHVDKDL